MTAVYEQPIEVVTNMPARPGAVAHRRKGWNVWPNCQPLHIHPCKSGPDLTSSDACFQKCVCKCDCTDLPKWFEHSALFAVNRGVALCPNTLCFGGQL